MSQSSKEATAPVPLSERQIRFIIKVLDKADREILDYAEKITAVNDHELIKHLLDYKEFVS